MTPTEWLEANPTRSMNDYYEWKKQQNPPPITTNNPIPTQIYEPEKSGSSKVIWNAVIFAFIFFIGFMCYKTFINDSSAGSAAYDYSNASPNRQKSETEIKQDLKNVELSNPSKYLSKRNGMYRVRLIRKEVVFTGTFNNNSTLTTFYDLSVQISFYSKTGTNMGTEIHTFYENIKPGGKSNYNKTIAIPNYISKKDLETVTLKILNAKGY
jgi:hypothetical protein